MADLETEIRNILYNDYGVGDQNIDSAEIYDKLVAKGIDPELVSRVVEIHLAHPR